MNEQYITIGNAKNMVKGHALRVKDVSGSRSYGYRYAIYRTERVTEPIAYDSIVGEPVATSIEVYEPKTTNKKGEPGAYRVMFKLADVQALLQ